MSKLSAPAALNSSDIIARAVSTRFNSRPTLRSETARLLKDGLLEQYPELDFDPYRTRIAQPIPDGAWRLSLLLDEVLQYLATGVRLELGDQYGRNCFLTNKVPKQMSINARTSRLPDMQVIARVILELPDILYIGLQEALTRYWNDESDEGTSRWQWLGDLLAGVMKTAAVRHAGIDATQAGVLSELANHPSRQARLQKPWPAGVIQACTLQTTLSKGAVCASLQTPDLLVSCAETHLLCSLTGGVEAYASLDDFGRAWAARFQQDFSADALTWKRFEPDGNIFDIQAALLLNQQLENLAALKLPANQPLDVLQQRIDSMTDVAHLFVELRPDPRDMQPLQATLPDWLQTASAVDRMAYRQHVLALASIKQQTQGRSFRDGIDDLHTFAKKALHRQMLEDQPQAPGYDADELELTFHVPVGDLGSGYLEKVEMSLTELAIKNLASKPKGRMTIRHTANQLIQDWTTEAYLLDLVKRVDVGKHYPELIDNLLLSDSVEARERERLFSLELSVQLPLQALEHVIKGEHGFDRTGYRYVNALLQSTPAGRWVGTQAIVIRPLAFQRKADADVDSVANMFVIEPKDLNADGPHILYRPLYTPALQQYPSRRDLLKAIALPGPLQTSVLTWLTDRARPVYANNGFNEPHTVHFHLGDDFTVFEKPAPAILVGDTGAAQCLKAVEENRLLPRLFVSNAQALVQLADHQSVSNAESRWAIILEGGWLIFNLLILPLDGPAMVVGWMLQITHSLINDLPALDSDDAVARNLAWTDLLLNIGLVLLHVAREPDTAPLPDAADKVAPVALEPLRDPVNSFLTSPDPVIHQAAPGLPAEPPGSGHTLVDFNLSTARDSAAARLFDKLQALHVAWPTPLPEPTTTGTFKGLYRINDEWHASLAGLLFRVRIVPGFGEVYLVHPQHPDHPGIKLKSNGRGQWSIDQGVKLLGGGPKSRIQAQRKAMEERIALLEHDYQTFLAQQAQVQTGVDIAEHLMNQQRNLPTASEQVRARFRQIYSTKLDTQTATYVTQIAALKEIAALKKSDPEYPEISALLENSINNVRKQIVIADLDRQATARLHPDFNNGTERFNATLLMGGAAARNRYFEFLRETSSTNEIMIKLYDEVASRLLELKELPRVGLDAWQRLTGNRPPNELTALRVRAFQLGILRPLSIKTWGFETVIGLDDAVDPVVLLSRSHSELQNPDAYESAERVAVLDNLVSHYSNAQDALESIGIFNSDELESSAFNRLREIIGELRVDAERRLADELQSLPDRVETPEPSAGANRPSIRPPAPRTSRKKVIKTDTKGTLIGELRPRTTQQGADIVDVKSPLEDSTLVSFLERTPNVWEEIIEPAQPAARAPAIAYPTLKGDARKALANVDRQEQKIEGYALRASSPKEIEEQLQREARKLTDYANKLEAHDDAPVNREPDAQLISGLRARADALGIKATELRIQMTLAKPPSSEGVAYLLDRRTIYARITGARVLLKTGRQDFMQEYILLDQQNQPLWYAHFHYANATDPKPAYTRAHLKTREQRYETYESALLKAKDPQQKIDIHHGIITEALAISAFLPLEPR